MQPIDLGGLGILNLEVMGWALQLCWLWVEKTNQGQPWAGLVIPVHHNTAAMFAIAVTTSVGNGANTLFWSDRWLLGKSIADLAPDVYKTVPARLRNSRTVAEALCGNNRITDIRAALSWRGLMEYLDLWATLSDFHLNDLEDTHLWRFENSGTFSTKSVYKAFFVGAIKFEPWKRLWKSWAPNKCKTFIWLAIRNPC
jgi:hypothetical protein